MNKPLKILLFFWFLWTQPGSVSAQYCIPQYTYSCQAAIPVNTNDYIDDFSIINAVSNFTNLNTGCNFQANNYIYYPGFTAQVARGCSFNFEVQCGPQFQQAFGIWIDWNNDNSFLGPGEFVWSSGVSGFNIFSGTINVPAATSLGVKRMRVRCQYFFPLNSPCALYDFGECEDYNIEVVNSPSIPPVAASDTICAGTQTLLTAAGAGLIQWYNSPTGGALLQNGPNFMTPMLNSTTTYYVQSTAGSCVSPRTAVVVTVVPQITGSVTALQDTVCVNGSTTLIASGGTNYSWSPANLIISGNGDSVQASISNQTTFSVVITNSVGCTATANFTVNTHSIPNPVILPANPGLCSGDPIFLHTSSGVSYAWSGPNILGNLNGDSLQVSPSNNASYQVIITDANGCTGVATTGVTVHPLPNISAGPDQSICSGSSANLLASGGINYQWSPGNYLNSTAISNPVCTPLMNTTYTVVGFDANGCSSTDQMSITANPLPIANPGNSFSTCPGTGVQLSGSGGLIYSWNPTMGLSNPNIANPVANPTSTTNYVLTVTDINGCTSASSAPITVTVYPSPLQPTVSASGPLTFCSGGSVTLSSSSASGNLWSNGSTNSSIVVGNSGTYSVQYTDNNGCISLPSSPVQVIVNGLPSASPPIASGPTSFCAGGSVNLSMPTGFISYQWSNGDLTPLTSVSQAGSYSCLVTDANGCSVLSNAINVMVFPSPQAPVIVSSGPVTFCPGDSVTLTATPVSASYLWSNGSTTQSINVSYAGNFSVNITDLNGCVSPPSTILSTLLFPPPVTPVINAQGPVPFCTGQNVTLDATGGLASFQWSNGQSTSSILVSQAGQFSVWGIDANGCETDTSAPFLVSLFPVPTSPIITASGPLTFCAGNSVQLSSSSPIGNLWSNGANTQNIVVSQTTIGIQVGYTDANGCPSPLSPPIDVNVIPLAPTPVISPTGSTILCEGDSVELICSQAQSFLWSTGETSQSIWVSQTGTVDVVVTDICNPATPQTSINIVVHPKPLADFQILKKIVCIPEPVEAQNLSQGNSIIQSWMLGDGTTQTENHLSHVFQFPGIYDLSIVVTDINGCTSTKTMIDAFEVHGTPVIEHTIHPRVSEEYGSSVHGHVLSEGVLNGQWTISGNNFQGNQFDFQPTVSGVIPVKFIGETQEGCTIEISDSILVKEAEKAFIPIAFTPNGDGKNDFFQPFISGFEGDYLFKIFNRWGGVIFSSNNPDYSWDGVGFPEGVYIWTLSFRGNNGSIIEKTGQVTLYR